MEHSEREVRRLETQLAQLRHAFEDAATPILTKLAEMRPSVHDSDKDLLIPRQVSRHSPGTRIPRHF